MTNRLTHVKVTLKMAASSGYEGTTDWDSKHPNCTPEGTLLDAAREITRLLAVNGDADDLRKVVGEQLRAVDVWMLENEPDKFDESDNECIIAAMLDGMGASEDHEHVIKAFTEQLGLRPETAKRLHEAMNKGSQHYIEFTREAMGQRLADYLTEHAETGSVTLDPFNSDEIDGMVAAIHPKVPK